MVPPGTHTDAICNLQAYITKEHMNWELRLTQSKFTYIDKWTSSDQINHKLSNQFWNNPRIIDAQITQSLNSGMPNIWVTIVKISSGPPCTQTQNVFYAPTMATITLYVLNPPHKRLRMARHNKSMHQIAHTL